MVYGLGFMVQGLSLRVYNNLVNYFDKKLNKRYKILFKMLSNTYGLGFWVLGLGFRV